MDLSIYQLSPDDHKVAVTILFSAFGSNKAGASEILKYFQLQPICWYAAKYENEPAGVVATINYGQFTYLGMMAVRKELQRKGIGEALLQRCLHWSEGMGITFFRLDASETGFGLYAKFNFRVIDQSSLFRLSKRSEWRDYPDNVSQIQISDIRSLADFDASIFGANRAFLFHALLELFPSRGFVKWSKSGEILGYIRSA